MPDRIRGNPGSFTVLNGLINCTHLPDIEGLEDLSKKHHEKLLVSYPDIRRMMMLGAMASFDYDVLTYLDLDAFVVGNFLPELEYVRDSMNGVSAVFSRGQIPGEICNGFYAIFDKDIIYTWIQEGIYAQRDINAWMRDRSYGNTFDNDTCITRGPFPDTCLRDSFSKDNATWRSAILPHSRYDRPECMPYINISSYRQDLKVYHCHSLAFDALSKKKTLEVADMLLREDDEKVNGMVKRRIGKTKCDNSRKISYNLESRGITWENRSVIPTWQTEVCRTRLLPPLKTHGNTDKVALDPLIALDHKQHYRCWAFPINPSRLTRLQCNGSLQDVKVDNHAIIPIPFSLFR